MPPRTRFSKDRLLDAGLALVQRDGLERVTARSLASEVGCSTAPVFTHFASMEVLHEQLLDRAMQRFVDAVAQEGEGDPLHTVGLGWLRFATAEPRLYEAIFLTRHPWHRKWGGLRRQLADAMARHPRYARLDRAFRFALVGRASVVLHGLGLELWAGRLPGGDERALLDELVLPVVNAAISAHWAHDLHIPGPRSRSHQESPS